MNVTQNYILSDARNMATSGSESIDFRIEDSQMLYWTDQIRATLIAQDIAKRKDYSNVWIQAITCLNLIEVDRSECCEVSTDCFVLRTELKIPRTIESNKENTIVRVTKPNGDIIPKINVFALNYANHGKYSSNKTKYYEKNDYIYIVSTDEETIEQINVYGIFDSPSDLAAYTSCDGITCYSPDDDYPCSMEMAKNIVDIMYKTKIIPFLNTPKDTTNDSRNEFDPQMKK